jgi:ribosomal protein S11
MLASERKVKALPTVTPVTAKAVDEAGFKYISCQSKNNELLFAFNPERKELLQQNDGEQVAKFDIQTLSETFIVATTIDSRVSINRISGSMQYQTRGIESKAQCVLTSKQRI